MLITAATIESLSGTTASILSALVKGKIERSVRMATFGRESLISAGNNNIVSFPVICSEDVPKSVAADIAQDVETVLAMATKNFLEGGVNREAGDMSIDNILASLPIHRMGGLSADNNSPVQSAFSALFAESLNERAKIEFDRLAEHVIFSEAQVELVREKGTTGTFINVSLPYISRKSDRDSGEIKTMTIQMGFEGIIRLCPKEELITRIGSYDTNRFFKNFIALSKKETSFISDFLLELDKLKLEAKTSVSSNKLWKTLDMMNKKRDIMVRAFPFTTFVISSDVAHIIKEKYMIDTQNERQVKALMDSFFAFSFYEVDVQYNTITNLRDGDSQFRKTTVDDMVRASTRVERKLKDLIKLG